MPPAENPPTPATAVKPADAAPSAAVQPLPPPRQPPSPERVAGRRRLLDGLIVAAVLLFAFLSALFPAHNSDFFLHAATGRLIAHGQYQVGVDPFAFTTEGAYWVNHNWLYDLIVYLFYDGSAAGGPILIILKALMVAALAEVMLRTAREPGRSLWVPACCVALAVLTLSPKVLLQPVCVSFFFLGLTYWLLQLPRRARARAAEAGTEPPRRPFLPLWLIPPLCLLWVNLDAWFLLGPAVVALHLLGETLQDALTPARDRDAAWPAERRTLLLVLVASVAACLVNPHHIWAFTPPPALGLSETAEWIGKDEQFRPLFASPFEGFYFYPQIGLNVAGLAIYPLALLGAASFAAAQWVGRWNWGRALVWAAFLALAVWHASGVPFFAVVAGPIMSLNFLDFAAKRLGTAAPVAGRAAAWAVGGRVLTLIAAVALLVAAWPGWLQAWPQEPRRVGCTVEPDPALRRLAERVEQWRRDRLVEADARWFNTSPAVLPYLAWYAPGARGCIDHLRLPLYDRTAGDFEGVRKSLARVGGDAGKPDPDWRKLLRRLGTHFVIWHDPVPVPMRNSSPLPTLLAAPKEWPLLYLNGPGAVFGWRDPSKEDKTDPFARLELDADRQAFGPGAEPAPAEPHPPAPRAWWAALWQPEVPRPPEADEAAVQLQRFVTQQPLWRERNEAKWGALWAQNKRTVQVEAAVAYFGTGGPWGGPFASDAAREEVRRILTQYRDQPPLPSATPQPGEEWQLTVARQLFDFGPPAPLYLSVRAARRALAVKADDARTHLALAQSYVTLVKQTREGMRAAAVAYPPGNSRYPLLLRRVQAATALHRALELDPDDAAAEDLATELYVESGFLDLARDHAKECLRIAQQTGAPEQLIKALSDQVDQLDKEVNRQQDTYLLKTANKPLMDKVQGALDVGLAKAALDELSQVDWSTFDDKDPNKLRGVQREMSLMVETGRGDEVLKELQDDEDKLRDGLGMDPDVMLPAYEWLRVEIAASRGDYAAADHWLGEMAKKTGKAAPLLAALPSLAVLGPDAAAGLHDPDTRSLAALMVGSLLLRQAPAAAGAVWLPLPLTDVRVVLAQTAELIAEPLGRQADLEAVRGWLALESGDIAAARTHFDEALRQAPADQIPFRGRGLTELGREWLEAGR